MAPRTHRGHTGKRVLQRFPNRAEQLDSEHAPTGASDKAHTRVDGASRELQTGGREQGKGSSRVPSSGGP